MLTVYKYKLLPGDNYYELPADATILSIGLQDSEAVMWAMVDTDAHLTKRRIIINGTGHRFPKDFQEVWRWSNSIKFLGTLQFQSGPEAGLVFHAFEVN